jgi:hypothetical protein
MFIRLRRGGACVAGLDSLRRHVAANGPRTTLLPVTISHPANTGRFDVYLNPAHEPDAARPRPATLRAWDGHMLGSGQVSPWHQRPLSR